MVRETDGQKDGKVDTGIVLVLRCLTSVVDAVSVSASVSRIYYISLGGSSSLCDVRFWSTSVIQVVLKCRFSLEP